MNSRTSLSLAGVLAFLLTPGPLRGQAFDAPEPDLQVLDEQTVTLSWEHAPPGFILQECDSPAMAARWKGIPQAPSASGSHRSVTLSLPETYTRWFFRLRPSGVPAGLDYLVATQASDGSWGSPGGTVLHDTTSALTALSLHGQSPGAVAQGIAAAFGRRARNNDDLARKATVLGGSGYDVSPLLIDLLATQASGEDTASSLAFPGRGWGLASGFGSSTIDTALVLRALQAGGRSGGVCVVNESVPAGGQTEDHPFQLPSGGSGLLLKVRSVAGGTLRFTLGGYYVDVAPRTTTLNVTFPFSPGPWILSVRNQGGAAASYSAEIGFTGPDAFDYFRITTPLLFLGLTQNADGGWGVARDEDSHLMITSEVLRTLAGWGSGFVSPHVLSAGVTWLLGHQNPDGGFSSVAPTSNVHETALAMLALHAASPGSSLLTAAAFLKSAQLPDGSWGSNPYLTAITLHALHLPPQVGPIPDQTVAAPTLFAAVPLDDYGTDPIYADDQLTWTVTGHSQLAVSIVDRVATITYPPATTLSEVLTFTATNPDGLAGSATATFAVNYQVADYTIAHGGSVSDSRIFTGASSVLDQAAYYTESQNGVPAGITYATTGVSRISATEMRISFQISVGAAAATGFQQFQVEYGLLDAGGNPLGPLSGNVFNLSILVTP